MAQSRRHLRSVSKEDFGELGHASLVTKIQYLEDFSRYRLYLMDPAGHSTRATFNNIYQIFSVWRP